jgi:hypothetical protein
MCSGFQQIGELGPMAKKGAKKAKKAAKKKATRKKGKK